MCGAFRLSCLAVSGRQFVAGVWCFVVGLWLAVGGWLVAIYWLAVGGWTVVCGWWLVDGLLCLTVVWKTIVGDWMWLCVVVCRCVALVDGCLLLVVGGYVVGLLFLVVGGR